MLFNHLEIISKHCAAVVKEKGKLNQRQHKQHLKAIDTRGREVTTVEYPLICDTPMLLPQPPPPLVPYPSLKSTDYFGI